nr:hypothetical protein [Tanacetum cinerariifolium]
SSSKLARDQTSNPTSSANPTPKDRIRRSSKQKVENSHFEERLTPIDTMTDNRAMAEMLRAPTEGCAEAIVVPPILAEQFELKHSLINMITSEKFFGLEKDNPHDHGQPAEPPRSITTCDDLVSKFINEFFPPSRTTNLHNEISIFQQKFDEYFHEAWERYKDLLRACPHHGFTELHQPDTFYNALNPADQDSLNAAAGGNLLEKSPQDALTIIKNKSKVRNSRSKPIASPVNACDNHSSSELAKLTHAVSQQTSAVTTVMMAMLKQFQSNPPPAQVKAVEEICVTCGGAHPYYQCLAAGGNTFPEYRDNIHGYVSAATGNFNQGNPGYRPQGFQNTSESSDDSTDVVNIPLEQFVVKQDHGSFVDKIICGLNKAPDSPHLHTFLPNQFHCFHCKDALGDGEACQRCTCKRCESGLSKRLCLICGNNQTSPNDSPSISANSSHNPPHIDERCFECGDALDRIFCQRCACKSCGKGAHIGYNCPPRVLIISNPEPCNQTMNNEPS